MSAKSVWVVRCLLCAAGFLTTSAIAQTTSPVSLPSIGRDAQRLSQPAFDRQIEKVLERPEFDWRQPEISHAKPNPNLQNWIAWIEQTTSSFYRWLADVWSRFAGFLRNFRAVPVQDTTKGAPFAAWLLNLAAYVLLAGIAGTVIIFAVRLLKRKWTRPPIRAVVSANSDLSVDETVADERPEEEWYKLAREKIASGELRQAQRAMFLAILSCLASRRLITIERWKSNCDYENELGRRAKHLPELPQLYVESRLGFERCWYGAGTLTIPELETYARVYERIRNAAS
jgi:hypothetical protein